MAQAWKLTIKNSGGTAIDLNDLGISIAASTNYVANDGTNASEFDQAELCKSWDLKEAISAATLVANDGTTDLSITKALRHLAINNDFNVNEVDAVKGANAPTASNVFATMADLGGIGADTLQSAYNNGSTITIGANGPVAITPSAANAALKIGAQTTKPTTLTEGCVVMMKDSDGNIDPAVYDGTRSKLLSIKEEKHSFTDVNNTKNRYVYYGSNRSNEAGSPVAENSTLVKAVVKCQASVTATIRIRKRSALGVDIATISLAAASSVIVKNLDVDLTAGDELSVYWDQTTGSADYPTIALYTKARF